MDEIIETKLPAWMQEIESSEAMDDIRWNIDRQSEANMIVKEFILTGRKSDRI